MGMAGICLMTSGEGFKDFRLRWASNTSALYTDSELEEVAFPLETSMGSSSIVFSGEGYSEA